jgi:hypothetical protein
MEKKCSATETESTPAVVLTVFWPWGEQAADKAAVAASVTPII